MSALAKKYHAINLSQGFPDFDCDDEIKSQVSHYMSIGKNQYAPMAGVMELREQISRKIRQLYRTRIDPVSEITITAGATQAIFSAIMALIHPGDEVIVFEPAYDSYSPSIKLAGGIVVPYVLTGPNFKVQWDELQKIINPKTKMLIINSPHNPSGTCLTPEDLQALGNIINAHDLFLLSDEVYEHIIFDGIKHQSALLIPTFRDRCLSVFSFGKTFHNTGWKIGYAVAGKRIMDEFRKVHQFNVFSVNTPVQHALADYLSDPAHYLNLGSFYQKKRDRFSDWLDKTRFKKIAGAGSYFQLVDYSDISLEDDLSFVQKLTKEHKVAAIPISVFRSHPINEHIIRFCFAKQASTLDRAGEKLTKV
jgi:methionine aminotransferase